MSDLNTLEVLKAARKKISDPLCWTQDWFAKCIDEDGKFKDTDATSPSAACWCSSGAIRAVLNADDYTIISDEYALPFGFASLGDLENYNDSHTHAEVLAAFDKAIASLEGK